MMAPKVEGISFLFLCQIPLVPNESNTDLRSIYCSSHEGMVNPYTDSVDRVRPLLGGYTAGVCLGFGVTSLILPDTIHR